MGNWFSTSNQPGLTIKIYELEKEIEALKLLNEELHQQIKQNREYRLRAAGGTALKISGISHDKLLEWVDDQLKKQESNCKWIPDFAERKLKADIFAMLLGSIEHILSTAKVEVMGHAIRFDLTNE